MSECFTCKRGIRGEAGVRCAGVCEKIYHFNEKCCGVDKCSLGALETVSMIKFICDDCIQYIHNVDFALKDMQLQVKKSSAHLKEYKNEFDSALNRNEHELKSLLLAIEARFVERIKVMEEVQNTCLKTVDEIKHFYKANDSLKQQSEKICNELIKNTTQSEQVISALNKVTTINTEDKSKTGGITYAEAAKLKVGPTRKKGLPKLKNEVNLVVKPKIKQNSQSTLDDLNKNVDPKNLKITNVKPRYNGNLVIESSDDLEREKIQKELEKKIGENYEIKVPNLMKPRCLITGMSFERDNNEILNLLLKQNDLSPNLDIKIIKTYSVKKDSRVYFNSIIETDADTFMNLLTKGKLNIGWEKCNVYDGIDVLQCFKCRGFNHKAIDCKNEVTCIKCLGNHPH